MPRRLRKPCSGQPCTSWRSRRRSRWTCWDCIVCARASSASGRGDQSNPRLPDRARHIIVRQGVMPLRKALPDILSSNAGTLSPRMVNLIAELVQDWRRLDERIAAVSTEIESLTEQDEGCRRVTSASKRRGVLQVDGYAGFERLTDRGDIVLAACWAHTRRKFFYVHEATGSPHAAGGFR